MKQLLEMLTYKRPHGSASEHAFIEKYILPLAPRVLSSPAPAPREPLFDTQFTSKRARKRAMKIARRLGTVSAPPEPMVCAYVVTTDPSSRYMFSAHTDTVHREGGSQVVLYDGALQLAYKDDQECLGADNAAGVWLLLQMIEANVPGTYVFHRGEEKGGIGSRAIAEHHAEFLRQFDYAIAFDRRGKTSVITHQSFSRCCSTTFATALGTALGMGHQPDDTGTFTDTANYTHLIPECTNVSVGYEDEHTPRELLDVDYLLALRDAVLRTFGAGVALPVARDHTKEETLDFGMYGWARSSRGTVFAPTTEEVAGMSAFEVEDMLLDMTLAERVDLVMQLAQDAMLTLYAAGNDPVFPLDDGEDDERYAG